MRKFIVQLSAGLFIFTFSQAQAMGRIPKKQYEAKVSELAVCNSALDSSKTRVGSLLKDMDSSKSELQKRVAEMTREKQDVEKEKERIEKEKQAEVDKLKSTYEDLVSDMKSEIEQGSIQITQLKDKLSVNMVDKILFNSGEADVNAAGKKVLDKVANVLKKVQNKQIRIEGHTDNIPIGGALKERFPSNWELSAARATTVARYLTESSGVNATIVSAAGYGQFRPIADNAKPEGRSKNRRIEIALVPLDVK